jgi:hypothetical protein
MGSTGRKIESQFKDTSSDIASGGGAGRTGGEAGGAFQPLLEDIKRQQEAARKPQTDAARDLIRRNIIIARIRRAAFAGQGRAATIATSPRGITGITPLTRRTLQAA